jgi:hypothetical protein
VLQIERLFLLLQAGHSCSMGNSLGNSLDKQFKAVRSGEDVLVESPLGNVHWCISQNGKMHVGQGKAILTSKALHLWNDKCARPLYNTHPHSSPHKHFIDPAAQN